MYIQYIVAQLTASNLKFKFRIVFSYIVFVGNLLSESSVDKDIGNVYNLCVSGATLILPDFDNKKLLYYGLGNLIE